jgi:ParB-like nuclease domain
LRKNESTKEKNDITQVVTVPANEVQSRVLSLVQDIPQSRIQESRTNPRRQFDEAELADNIRLHGIFQPVLVRPMPDGEPGTYELVAGARRFRASKLAKREDIPANSRILNVSNCNPITCNEPTCTNSTGRGAMPHSRNPCRENRTFREICVRQTALAAADTGNAAGVPHRQAHRRMSRIYGWEEKKTKSSGGGSCVDYDALARKAAGAMSRTEVQHFLVGCALVSDLYCPGYNPRQPLANDSNLARAAARYKFDVARLAGEVRQKRSKKSAKDTSAKSKNKSHK